MFISHYPNFVNVRSADNCKCSILIRRTELALSVLYKHTIIIIIIIIISFKNRQETYTSDLQ